MLPDLESHGKLVVCEDDDPTRVALCDNLTADRFEVMPAETAQEALRLCRYGAPDLLLLDLNLPDASGLDVLRRIRVREEDSPFDPELPVIVLSGRSSTDDRVRGLGEGADDYLVKPFTYRELLLRLRRQLARRDGGRRRPLRIGALTIDVVGRRVQVDGRSVRLAAKEFELLRALSADPVRVFTKQELLAEIWGHGTGSRTRTLDSHASRLRRKLDPEGGRYIVNCWGVGYRLLGG
jgi:two-component system response regulator PrrA